MGRRLAGRFVAGTTVEDAVAACERVNAQGMAVSLDSLGESVAAGGGGAGGGGDVPPGAGRDCGAGAEGECESEAHADGHGGISAGRNGLAEEIVGGVVEHAARVGSFVRIDMEGSAHTEATIAMTERLHARFPGSVGTVLQAYLYRTEADAERLLGQGIRIRLCKGAYKEGPEVAFPRKADVDANYVKLMKRMVTSGVFCGIATHDEAIVEEMRRFVGEQGMAKSAFEFQMLYGVRRGLQRRLAAEGYGVRVYIPFGTAWYPYFMRRLAERPANVVFLARNLFRA